MIFEDVFTIRINYASGISEEFECLEFSATFDASGTDRSIKWTSANNKRPLFIGLEKIESIWQVSSRRRLKWR